MVKLKICILERGKAIWKQKMAPGCRLFNKRGQRMGDSPQISQYLNLNSLSHPLYSIFPCLSRASPNLSPHFLILIHPLHSCSLFTRLYFSPFLPFSSLTISTTYKLWSAVSPYFHKCFWFYNCTGFLSSFSYWCYIQLTTACRR